MSKEYKYVGRQTDYHRAYYYKRRREMLALVGDRCNHCGATEGLQFDHVDPALKSFDIKSNMTAGNPAVREELKKCQLLCADCHQKKTATENSGFTHGTVYAWRKAHCGCRECARAKREWNDKRNATRRRETKAGGARGRYGRPSTHGQELHYKRGCRCSDCRAANASAQRERIQAKELAHG